MNKPPPSCMRYQAEDTIVIIIASGVSEGGPDGTSGQAADRLHERGGHDAAEGRPGLPGPAAVCGGQEEHPDAAGEREGHREERGSEEDGP